MSATAFSGEPGSVAPRDPFDRIKSVEILRPEPGDMVILHLSPDASTEECEEAVKGLGRLPAGFEGVTFYVEARGDRFEVLRPSKRAPLRAAYVDAMAAEQASDHDHLKRVATDFAARALVAAPTEP